VQLVQIKRIYINLIIGCVLILCGDNFKALSRQYPPDQLLQKIRYHQGKQLDSSFWYINVLQKYAAKEQEEQLAGLADLLRIETHIKYRNFAVADSLIATVEGLTENSRNEVMLAAYKGKLRNSQNQREEALEMLYQALEKAKSQQYEDLIINIYFYIAEVLSMVKDFDESTRLLHFVLRQSNSSNIITAKINASIEMCIIYNGWMTVNLDSSIYYGRRAMQLAKDYGDELLYYSAMSSVSAPLIRKGNNEEGLKFSKLALAQASKFNFSINWRYNVTANQGFVFEKWDMYDSAIYYMQQAKKIKPASVDLIRLKHRIYKAEGKYDSALQAFVSYHQQVLKANEKRSKQKIANLQARKEVELKERALQTLAQQTAIKDLKIRQKNQTIVIIVIVIIFSAILLFILYNQRLAKGERQRVELEQRFLRSQLNPHFIFNSLNYIQNYVWNNEKEKAGIYIGKFAKLMRQVLQSSREKFISLEEEIKMLENYMALQALQPDKTFLYKIEIDQDIEPKDTAIPPMFVQPFVENAIEHGIVNNEGFINIKFIKYKEIIQITITDNGIGLSESGNKTAFKHKAHNSLATSIIKERMESYNKKLETAIEMHVSEIVGEKNEILGTKVELRVPYL